MSAGLAILVAIGALLLSAIVGDIVRARVRAQRIRNAWFQLFVLMMPQDDMVADVGIDADWVALHILGLPLETKIKKLPPDVQAAAVEWSELARLAGESLVASGHFQYMRVSFENQGRNQKINPPPTLFRLAPKGRSLVLRMRTEAHAC